MCAVYRVIDPTDATVERAIKVLVDDAPHAEERFIAEAALLMQLNHPNVLKVFSIESECHPPWIEMELLAGRDMEEQRELVGPRDPELAASWFADLAAGLAMVHAKGIRHRDLKPHNIMLGTDGVPKLIDFGIARDTGHAHMTQQGFVLGTAAYLPPEVFFEEDAWAAQDSEQADVYALGLALCEVLTGVTVFPMEDSSQALAQVMRDKLEKKFLDPREWWSKVPSGLAQVVIDATQMDPPARIPSATAFEKRLRDWLETRSTAHTAPISRLDPSKLPPPPKPGESLKPLPSPLDERPSPPPPQKKVTEKPAAKWESQTLLPIQDNENAPPIQVSPAPKRRGLTILILSFVASIAAVLGLSTVTAMGVAVLWALQPATGPVNADALWSTLDDNTATFKTCARGTLGEATVSMRVQDSRASQVIVESGALGTDTLQCISKTMESLSFPSGPPAAVEVTLQFRPPVGR